jgi:cyclophilin family peptidyl-prolyl cis-trans isomerase
MILAPATSQARRLASVGLLALLLAGCASVPAVAPTASPAAPATIPPTTPPYTLAPTPEGCPTTAPAALSGTATVTMTTNFGTIVIKVDSSLGPNAAGTFVALAKCGYYNNVIFHRIVTSFVIQAGDGTYGREPALDVSKIGTGGPSWSVTDDKVTTAYKRGTVALANTGAANSANSQFFIVLSDTAWTATTPKTYSIFGDVTSGLDVVDRIAKVPTGGEPGSDGSPASLPLQPIVITGTTVATP